MYTPQVLDHFQNPRNAGDLPDADAVVELSNPACGDILRLAVKLDDGRVGAVRFRCQGCVPAVACASRLTEMMIGRDAAGLRVISRAELVDSLGGLPLGSSHAGHLAMDALRRLLCFFE
ncbi:MAG TPA: iron-sulfur cluster assembly scaffold protein [Terriglobales bacterium]|nr:iron-sulfur cluster assembly scaffold protein [Terriglobales bacterium]